MSKQRQQKILLHQRFLSCYKKHTLAVFFSFTLTFLLATTLLVLIHTNHRIENIQAQTLFTPADCRIENLSAQQLQQLQSNPAIDHLAIALELETCTLNKQMTFLHKGDAAYITLMATVITGRLPQTPDEIVAEKWTLLNLGIEPTIGQEFSIQDKEGKPKTVKLVGILSDMSANKKYGTLNLYAGLEESPHASYLAYVHLAESGSYDSFDAAIQELISALGIRKKQVKKCPAREDYQELQQIDAQVISVLLLICLIVFYGIYRIALATREKTYGILRAIGMKRKQLQHMILLELYQIYFFGALAGIAAGLLLSFFIVTISGDRDTVVYLHNQSVQFAPVIPFRPILLCVAVMAMFIGIIAYVAGRQIACKPAAETIAGRTQDTKSWPHIFQIRSTQGKLQTLLSLSCSYIVQDLKTSGLVVLTICTGVTLFTGLAYRAQTLRTYREDTKELLYLNGQYEMSMLSFDSPYQGVSRQSAQEIQKLPEVSQIKTAAGMPVRVIDEDGVKRNDAYYEEINASMKKYNGFELRGHDGTNQIYKSILYGYNAAALKELKKYVVSGDFDAENIKEDEIILAILSMDDTKPNGTPEWYQEGTRLMQYQAGDEIEIKYRQDFQADANYETLSDFDKEYSYKTYKVAAIVSFSYMYNCIRSNVYPLLITSDQQIQAIVPDSCFQCMNIETKQPEMTLAQQEELERKLIRIGASNRYVATRSMISEIKQNEMFYRKQMIYVYGMAIVVFVLVLINLVNSLRYRMHARTQEICMLRAVGLSVAMAKRLMVFENAILGTIAVLLAFALSQPVLRYLYHISDMAVYGHKFYYDYAAFFGIAATTLAVCMVLSCRVLPSWKTRQIMEAMGKVI